MHHLSAFFQNVNNALALLPIAAVPDQVVTVQGNDVRVPAGLTNIVGQAALINSVTGLRAQIQSPSLRAIANVDVEPIINALVFGSPPEQTIHGDSPIPLQANESLNFAVANNAAVDNYGLVWIADGPLQAVKGSIYTVRATGAATLAAGAWVNTSLTFAQTLPVGRYQIVGVRARGANLVAARLVFIGGTFRPGVAALNAIGDLDPWYSRYGSMGVFGEFDSTTPPTVDCLGVTDAAQVFDFDLIKTK